MSGKRYYWFRLKEDFFQDKRIKRIRQMAGGDTYTIIFLKMQLKALRTDGYLYFDNVLDDFVEELALDIDESPDNVRFTIEYLLRVGLLEICPDGKTYYLTELEQLIGSETATAQRVRDYRARRKQEAEALQCNTDETKLLQCNTDVTETLQCNTDVTDVKRLCYAEKEIEKEIDITDSKESVCRTGDVRRITEAWNSLGLGQISKLTGSSKRGGMLRARVNEYGADAVLQAIEKIRNSSFLRGQNRRGWTITFDWFVRPNNFPKVLEGQYDDHEGTAIDQSSLTPSSDHEFWGWG